MWLWINCERSAENPGSSNTQSTTDSKQILEPSKPRLSPYDFSGQGVLGIWDGGPQVPTPRRAADSIPPSPVGGLKSIADHVKSASTDGRSNSKSRDLAPSSRRGSRLLLDTHPLSTSSSVQEDDYSAALNALCLKAGDTGGRWKPGTPTSKMAQRRMCLQLVGWSLREEELNHAITK